MPPSIVEKYEQILAADPRSRIFVELAKALVERGEATRAAEVCRRGLEHHPSSILGRVVWGRALLETGEPAGALAQFEAAVAVDASSPYAFNLVGEALLAKKLHAEALPYLERALELQPADTRVRGWVEQARRQLGVTPPSAPARAAAEDDDETTVALGISRKARTATPTATGTPTATASPTAPATPNPTPTSTATGGGEAEPGAESSRPPPPVLSRVAPSAPGPSSDSDASPGTPAAPPTPPPLRAPPTPPPLRADAERSVLYMIPGESTRDVIGPSSASRPSAPRAAAPAPSAAEADRLAQQFAEELRQKLLAETPVAPASRVRLNRRVLGAAALVLAIGAAAAVYLVADARRATALAATAAVRARAGLGRDTLGSLGEAARLLSEARRASDDPELVSLSAQVAAVLAAEHGDDGARRLAAELARDPRSGDGGRAAEYLLAATPDEVKAAEASLLDAHPSSPPLVQALAGRVLVGRGELEAGRGRLEIAARSNPPLLRALADLGDLALREGDADRALALYGAALGAHATHPRSVVGAAEARLALGRDLDASARELAAVEADPGSAPPRDLRLRFQLVAARVEVARGEPAAAAARL
ncbi:M48 family metallopeptidase, partial [Anaeromyxobacter sp. SG17]|uniref:tetratricopeptide repeat protein n=2 Tax=unclassified Anaeromyxobacter TaxID=2620896 RepID=UPI001F57D752